MNGFTKVTELGNDNLIILAPREQYIRQAALTTNWTRCRIGLFLSFTSLSNVNAEIQSDALQYSGVMDQLSIGVSNGIGTVGQVGNRYIGIGRPPSAGLVSPSVGDGNHFLTVGSSPYGVLCGMVGNGTSVATNTGAGQLHGGCSSTAQTGFARPVIVDIRILNNGAADGPATADVQLSDNLAAVTDVSISNLRSCMSNGAYTPLPIVTGGWWNGAGYQETLTIPSGCDYLTIRHPSTNYRLRIHAMRVLQIE